MPRLDLGHFSYGNTHRKNLYIGMLNNCPHVETHAAGLLLEHSNVCARIPELPGITRNYPELGGTGSS